jgi:hypothetical protein
MDRFTPEGEMMASKAVLNKVADMVSKVVRQAVYQLHIEKPVKVVLNGSDIVEHLRHTGECESATFTFFRYYSKAWQAIHENICKDQDCVFVDHEGRSLFWHRGSGPVSFRSASLYAPKSFSPRVESGIRLELAIDYYRDEDRSDESATRTESVIIGVPIDIELNFTPKKFNAWIAELKKERDFKRSKEDLVMLVKLAKKYPESIRSLARLQGCREPNISEPHFRTNQA